MTTKTKGRDRGDGATPKASTYRDHTNDQPLMGSYGLAKASRTELWQKGTWKRGRAGK